MSVVFTERVSVYLGIRFQNFMTNILKGLPIATNAFQKHQSGEQLSDPPDLSRSSRTDTGWAPFSFPSCTEMHDLRSKQWGWCST
mmetsp:Transcript_1301/g.4001  ORF Transcript_1301/g.4001 Transcript_1301/m.4001 type:complete len:85 (-) Transcript_1301:146-400(-)